MICNPTRFPDGYGAFRLLGCYAELAQPVWVARVNPLGIQDRATTTFPHLGFLRDSLRSVDTIV